METRKTQLIPNRFYHIYNRGINGETLFKEEKNYDYFLAKYAQFIHPLVDTYAYSLLDNHFHILIKTKSAEEISLNLLKKPTEKSHSWHLSNCFSSLFKSYAQAINKGYKRTGGLFEEAFHRINVSNTYYLNELIWYIHFNPQKHGFIDDFRSYPHSSYNSYLGNKITKLQKEKILELFENKEKLKLFYNKKYPEINIKDFIIEF